MKLSVKFTYIISILLLLNSLKSIAQLSKSDSLFYIEAKNKTIIIYHNTIGNQAKLLNGRQYAGYPFSFKTGHPYFESDEFSYGTIEYDKVIFPNVKLLYNEVSGVILINEQTHFTELITEKISSFTLFNNNFKRIIRDSTNNITTGFYNFLYDGNVKILKLEKKIINEDISNSSVGIVRTIIVKNQYILQKNEKYYPILKKNSFLEQFQNHKKEISEYIKAECLNFKKDKQNYITKVAAFFDQISK